MFTFTAAREIRLVSSLEIHILAAFFLTFIFLFCKKEISHIYSFDSPLFARSYPLRDTVDAAKVTSVVVSKQ